MAAKQSSTIFGRYRRPLFIQLFYRYFGRAIAVWPPARPARKKKPPLCGISTLHSFFGILPRGKRYQFRISPSKPAIPRLRPDRLPGICRPPHLCLRLPHAVHGYLPCRQESIWLDLRLPFRSFYRSKSVQHSPAEEIYQPADRTGGNNRAGARNGGFPGRQRHRQARFTANHLFHLSFPRLPGIRQPQYGTATPMIAIMGVTTAAGALILYLFHPQ